MGFKKGDKVVRVLRGAGTETASLSTIAKVAKGVATLTDSEWQKYLVATGESLEDPIPGFSTRIIKLEE